MGSKITKDQVAHKLQEANTILIITRKSPTISYLAAGLAMSGLLQSLNKTAVFVHSGDIPMNIGFLRPEDSISSTAETLRNFIISINKSKVQRFSYSKTDQGYDISLTPATNESITSEDLSYRRGDFNVDMILALGIAERSEISSAINDHAQLMEETPMINLLMERQSAKLDCDHWQMMGAGSLGEMIYELSRVLGVSSLGQPVANAMLTSIVDHTNHYKNQTLAQTMHVSGDLIERGADLQMIADNLASHVAPVEDEVKEMVKEALTPDKSQTKVQDIKKNPKRTIRPRQPNYISVGDVETKLEVGKKLAKSQAEEKADHKPEEIAIDAQGGVMIQSQATDEKPAAPVTAASAAEKPAVAPATPSGANANMSPSGVTPPPANQPVASSDLKPAPSISGRGMLSPTPDPARQMPATSGNEVMDTMPQRTAVPPTVQRATPTPVASTPASSNQPDSYLQALESANAPPPPVQPATMPQASSGGG